MEISARWPQKALGSIAGVEWGNTSITKASYVDSGYPAFSATGCDGFLSSYQWDGPAVVLSAIGARCGKCFLAADKWTAIKNTIVIQGNEKEVSHKFLFHYLNDSRRWKISGSGQPFITLKTARETFVPVPTIVQQYQIVSEIEKQFTRLEAGVAALRRVQANLKRYRAAVLKAACEGKLVENEVTLAKREGRKVETGEELLQRILAERRKKWKGRGKYKEPVGLETKEEPIPPGWVWCTWEQVGLSQNGRPFRSAEYRREGVKLLRPGNLHVSGKVIWDDENTRRLPVARQEENPDLVVRGG